MSDLDPANVVDATQDGANDKDDLAAAYEALAEDRRHQQQERTDVNAARSSEPQSDERGPSLPTGPRTASSHHRLQECRTLRLA